MKRIWNTISYLGLTDSSKSLTNKAIVLTNQINFIMFILLIGLNITTTIIREIEGGNMTFGSFRLIILLIVNILIFILSYYRLHTSAKVSLVFLPAFVIIIFPTIIGFVEQESFFYYAISIIAFSAVPQLILIPNKEKIIFILSMFYFFLQILFYDDLLIYFAREKFVVTDIIKDFYFINKIVNVSIFFFIHFSIYYLRKINVSFQSEINESNNELNSKIEELKKAEQHLVQSEKMASLGTLTAGIAHEINNPLNFVSGGLQLISSIENELTNNINDEVKEKFKEAVSIVESGLNQADHIISSLRTFSFKGSSKLTKSNFSEIIESTLLFLKSKIDGDINIIKDYQLTEEIPVYPDKLHQIILNLIDNAIFILNQLPEDFDKKISVKTYSEKDNFDIFGVIEIFNTGPNVPEEIINKLFDPFFTTKEPGKGTGLGLSICYSLINEHNGNIIVNNTEEGVLFRIRIPL
jgi:signal transduction histidine kinase